MENVCNKADSAVVQYASRRPVGRSGLGYIGVNVLCLQNGDMIPRGAFELPVTGIQKDCRCVLCQQGGSFNGVMCGMEQKVSACKMIEYTLGSFEL